MHPAEIAVDEDARCAVDRTFIVIVGGSSLDAMQGYFSTAFGVPKTPAMETRMAFVRKLAADIAGTSAVEYGMICALMVIGLIAGIESLGASVADSFTSTATAMHNVSAS